MVELQFPMMDQVAPEVIKLRNMEKQFHIVKYDILVWESDESLIWDSDPINATKFLNAVDEVKHMIQYLNEFQWTKAHWQEHELLSRASDILQIAMARLEMEFTQLLLKNCPTFACNDMSFGSSEVNYNLDASSTSSSSFGEVSTSSSLGSSPSESTSWEGSISVSSQSRSSLREDLFIRMRGKKHNNDNNPREFKVSPMSYNVLCDIKHIAEVMFASNHEKECCQAYVSARKNLLDEFLSRIQIDKLGTEEIFHMNWVALSTRIARWKWAMKVLFQSYLANEKNFCYKIFAELSETATKTCFVQISQDSLLQLLNFGQGVAITFPSEDRLFCILDMYEQLTDLMPEIKELFPEVDGSYILSEYHELAQALVRYVKGALFELKNAIQHDPFDSPYVGGGIHPMARYVMNYLIVLAEYGKTLNHILDSPDNDQIIYDDSAVTLHIKLIISTLELRLNTESMLYNDESLQHLFMMNNINYMVDKVNSDLLDILGKEWLKKHTKLYQQHAINCERASWGPVLALLKRECVCTPDSSPCKKILKQRFKIFNHSFEDAYKTQTSWQIPNDKLREDMRISVSLKVLQAYRSFNGVFGRNLENERHKERYIKYTVEDLERYLLDLFEGRTKSLSNHRLRR